MNFLDETGHFSDPSKGGGTGGGAAVTVDTLGGASTLGKTLLKSGNADAALTALGTVAITAQTAPAALTAAPAQKDFNDLITLLKTAGVLK